MLYLTVFAYFLWGTRNCLDYYQPSVFTATVPNQNAADTENYQIVAGVNVHVGNLTYDEIFQNLAIVFYDTSNSEWYNAQL